MIAVDTNILVHAHRSDSPFNARAFAALSLLANGRQPWAIPWPCVHEFYSVVTHPRIWDPPTAPTQALAQLEAWLERPSVRPLAEPSDYWGTLRGLAQTAQIAGPRIHDARIAAICLAHGVSELWTADRDFSRFPGLRTVNPIVG